jgi:hypothetical protein
MLLLTQTIKKRRFSKGTYMNSEHKLPGFLATRRVGDRRNEKLCAPYSTGTGVILTERRSGNDRRATSAQMGAEDEKVDVADISDMPGTGILSRQHRS